MARRHDKTELKRELVTRLEEQLATARAAHAAATEGAISDEARPENDKDTRGLEQSYLARGQAKRVEEMRSGLRAVASMALRELRGSDPIASGALVVVAEDDRNSTFFLAPHSGGTKLDAGAVQVITPQSPLGHAFLGRRVRDVCEVKLAGKTREFLIVRVS